MYGGRAHPTCHVDASTAWLVWALPRSSGRTVVTCVKTLGLDERQKRQQQTPRHEGKGFGLSGVVGNAEEETTIVLTLAEWLGVAFAHLFCARAFCRPEPGVRYSHSLTPSLSLSARASLILCPSAQNVRAAYGKCSVRYLEVFL